MTPAAPLAAGMSIIQPGPNAKPVFPARKPHQMHWPTEAEFLARPWRKARSAPKARPTTPPVPVGGFANQMSRQEGH